MFKFTKDIAELGFTVDDLRKYASDDGCVWGVVTKNEVDRANEIRLIPLTQVPLHIVCDRFGRRANRTC
jgi:hypothetical protein